MRKAWSALTLGIKHSSKLLVERFIGMANESAASWGGEVAKAFFAANLEFYDKSPIVASTGYLLLMSSIPLYLLLRFASRMKALDNEVVLGKLKIELDREALNKGVPQDVVNNTTTAGG
ncbi:hypothetical protein ACLPHD_12515 [Serratia odorifera]|uniref:hypothetical protein n=1 Tax=Serratia odorifera TaxID=618 RepID=UPI003D27A486